MKIYKAVYDAQRPSAKQVTAPLDSTFGVAVGVVDGGERVDLGIDDVTVNGVSAQAVLDGGFALFALASGDEPGGVRLPVKWTGADKSRDFELVVAYAEQGVIEGYGDGGGDVPADVATKSWVQGQISDFVDADDVSSYVAQQTSSFVEESDLTAYATKEYVGQETSSLVDESELTAYAEKSELTAYAEKSDLTAYATKEYVGQETSSFVDESDLTAYATKDYVSQETSSLAEKSELTAYATKEYVGQETSSFVEESDLTAYATKDYVGQQTSSYVDAAGARDALSGTTLSASQAAELWNEVGIYGHDDPEGWGTDAPGLTAIQTVYESEWAYMSADAETCPNTMFVVLADPGPAPLGE